jgi:hypothetical protein
MWGAGIPILTPLSLIVGAGPDHTAGTFDQALGRAQMVVEVPLAGGPDLLNERVSAPTLRVDLMLAYFEEQSPIVKSTN